MSTLVELIDIEKLVVDGAAGTLRIGADGTLQFDNADSAACKVEKIGSTLRVTLDGNGGNGGIRVTNLIGSTYSSSGSISIANNAVISGATNVSFANGGRDVTLRMPANGSLTVNGRKFSVAALAAGKLDDAPTEATPKRTWRLVWRDTTLSRVVLKSAARVWLDNVPLSRERFSAMLDGTSSLVLPSSGYDNSGPFESVSFVCSGTAQIDAKRRVTKQASVFACGMAQVRELRVLRAGKVETSGMASVAVAAYARECIERHESGMSRIQVDLLTDLVDNSKSALGSRKRARSDGAESAKKSKKSKKNQ